MSVFHNNILGGAASSSGGAAASYQIDRSLRFNDGDTPSLTHTVSTSSNRRTFTFSFWVKRSESGRDDLYKQGSDPYTMFLFRDDDVFGFDSHNGSLDFDVRTTRKFRDFGAWMHIVLAVDTTQATNSNRVKLYINGVQETLTPQSSGWPDQNYDTFFNHTSPNNAVLGNSCNGYLADWHFVDGQQLAATDFGLEDSNKVWQPKAYSGSHGTNGFHLNFSDTADLGNDSSGNNNDFTPNNLVGSAGLATANQGFDVMTYTGNGGEQAIGAPVYSDQISGTQFSSGYSKDRAFDGDLDNRTFAAVNSANLVFTPDPAITVNSSLRLRIKADSTGNNGSLSVNGTDYSDDIQSGSNWLTIPNVTSLTEISFGKSTGNGHECSSLAAIEVDGEILRNGNGGDPLNFKPDLVWIKRRSSALDHIIWDSVRGITKELYSNQNYSEGTATNKIESFNSNGFSLKNNNSVNGNNDTFVAWCWKAGGTASSNTDGTITSQVSANTTHGFSIVTYTGSANGTVGHGLGSAPKLIIAKSRTQNKTWPVYTSVTGKDKYLVLNSDTGEQSSSGVWGSSEPTSTVFGIENSASGGNTHGDIVAYCWSEVSGFSKFGSYSGSGSSGNTITTGFKPRFVLLKRTSAAENWLMIDSERGDNLLFTNLNNGDASSDVVDFTDTGFKLKQTGSASNATGSTYFYAAFADKPDNSIIDSLIDTPTNYEADSGNNGGNYATISAVDNAGVTLSQGNLEMSTSGWQSFKATIGVSSGKWYWETQNKQVAAAILGVATQQASVWPSNSIFGSSGHGGGDSNPAWTWAGQYSYFNGTSTYTGHANHAVTDIIMYALDLDNGKLWFGKNGAWFNSSWGTTGNPATGANPTVSGLDTSYTYFPAGTTHSGGAIYNFGQRPFEYTPPSGFKSLCTQNLDDPTIGDGSTAFDVSEWVGNSSNRSIDLGFGPDFVWIKAKSNGFNHQLFDILRGANKTLNSNGNSSESTASNSLTSFNSDGFSLGTDNNGDVNGGGPTTYYAWSWDGGTSTASNSDGSITSSVRVNQSAGFSIATYTGNGTTNSTVGHGLNAAPSFVIIKNRSNSYGWAVLHTSAGTTGTTLDGSAEYYMLQLDSSAARNDFTNDNIWNPTSSTFKINGSGTANWVNANNDNYVAYSWAPVAGYSSFGKYTGNGNANGPFVYTGFRPAMIITKRTDANGGWVLWDTKRNPSNLATEELYPDDPSGEYTGGGIDILSNGFKLKNSSAHENTNNASYIFAAWAEHPFKTARAR